MLDYDTWWGGGAGRYDDDAMTEGQFTVSYSRKRHLYLGQLLEQTDKPTRIIASIAFGDGVLPLDPSLPHAAAACLKTVCGGPTEHGTVLYKRVTRALNKSPRSPEKRSPRDQADFSIIESCFYVLLSSQTLMMPDEISGTGRRERKGELQNR